MSIELWVEKYRPGTLGEYVWRDPAQRTKVEEWLTEGVLPHLLFSGVQGTGKTSLAKIMLKQLGIPPADILEVNASRERQIDAFQDKISGFVGAWPMGDSGIKYILLDEADRLSPLAQDLLKGEMETYSDICRFILTCNEPRRIVPPIHSRCQGFVFHKLDREDFFARIGEILVNENVTFDVETINAYVALTYPDLRKAINLVQQGVQDSTLHPPHAGDEGEKDYVLEMISLFRQGRYLDGRKLIVASAQAEEYPDIFRVFYRNLDLFGASQQLQDEAVLVIAQGLVNHAWSADAEINLSATLIRLCNLNNPQWSNK